MPIDTRLLPDEDAEYTGWIEIENCGPEAANLDRFGLSDDPGRPFKWTFPELSLPAGGRVIVFTSGKNRRDPSGLPHVFPAGQPLAPELRTGLALWLDATDADSLVLHDGRVAEWQDRSGQPYSYADPAPKSPDQFSGLVTWLDASASNRLVLSQGLVSQWRDRSSTGIHASQEGAARRPRPVSDSASGRMMVRFDGVDDLMALPRMGTVGTVIWVGREDAAAALGYGTGVGDSQNARWERGRLGCLYQADDGSGAATWTKTVRYNGETVDPVLTPVPRQTVVVTTVASSSVGLDGIASSRGTGGSFWQGDLAEIVVFNRVLNAAEYGAIEAYLMDKWKPPRPPRQGYRHATQTLPEWRPILVVDPVTRLPLVRFDGMDDFLAFPRMSDIATAFGVLRERPGADNENRRPWLGDPLGSGFFRGTDGLLYSTGTAAGVAPAKTRLDGALVDAVTTRLPSRLVSIATRTAAPTLASTLSFDRAYRGWVWDGDYGEVLLYNRALTDTEIDAVIDYLHRKWGLPPRFLHTSFALDAEPQSLLLTTPEGTVADRLTLPALVDGVAFGRPGGEPGSISQFLRPSPGEPNPPTGFANLAPAPIVEPNAVFHSQPVLVKVITNDWAGPVYYTRDGSEPGEPRTDPYDVVWLDDCLPDGASYSSVPASRLEWVAEPAPYSGGYAVRSQLGSGLHYDIVKDARQHLAVRSGDRLFAYVYLDPAHPPREVMFQWRAGASWEHRAYWGEDLIAFGQAGTHSRLPLGPSPPTGQWVRLEAPAAAVGLEEAVVTGFSVAVDAGRIWWDRVGRSTCHDGDSRLYTGPVLVSTNSVLRWRAAGPGSLPSPIVTRHYLFDPPSNIAVVALATPPEGLFSQTDGIFVMGTNAYPRPPYYMANFWCPWERQTRAEFFEPDQTVGFSQDVGVLVRGAWSRASAQKSIELEARRRYGAGNIHHRVFPQLELDTFDCLVLGQRGIDFRDPLVHSLMTGTAADILAGRPAHVYFNAQYWGIYYIQEKIDETYLVGHHGSEAIPADLVEDGWDPKSGDWLGLYELSAYMQRADLTTPEGYAGAQARMDIDNFIDYQLIEIFADNRDWFGHNVMNWRPRREGGVWRWLVKDVDWTFDVTGDGPQRNTLASAIGCGARECSLLRRLLDNTAFRHMFINRFGDYLNTRFSADAVLAQIDAIADEMRPEVQRHIDRWRNVPNLSWTPYEHIGQWEDFVESFRAFARARPAAVRGQIVNQFSLSGTARLELTFESPSGGRVRLNSLEFTPAQLPWSGVYFRHIPLLVEAVPAPGYRFLGWLGRTETAPQLSLTLDRDTRLTPRFEPDPDYDPSNLRPVPHDLARGDYSFGAWSPDAQAGTFPPHLLFLQTTVKDPGLTAAMTGEWNLPYNRSSRSRLLGLGELGVCFLNTSDPQPEADAGYLGAALLALQTRGMSNVTVTWTAGTLEPNNRLYAIRLQYRLDPNGEFHDALDAQGEPIEYIRSPIDRRFPDPGSAPAAGANERSTPGSVAVEILLPANRRKRISRRLALGRHSRDRRWRAHPADPALLETRCRRSRRGTLRCLPRGNGAPDDLRRPDPLDSDPTPARHSRRRNPIRRALGAG